MAKAVKQQVFCNFVQYIKDRHPEFRDLVSRSCSRLAFKPPAGKGISGITILFPDAAFKAKIEDLLYGPTNEDFVAAGALVRSCVIHAYLPTAASFTAQKDDIPSSNGKRILVDNVEGDTVTLAGGCKIVPDREFRTPDQGNGKQVAFWYIKSGQPKISDEPAKYLHASLRKGGYYGGSTNQLSPAQVIRNLNRTSYMRTILYAYHAANVAAKSGTAPYRMPLLEYSASLIGYIADKYPDYLPDALCVCNVGFSDIVLLLEPDCTIEPLIPDRIVDEWWDNRTTYPIVDTYTRAFKAVANAGACFSKRAEVAKAFNAYRDNNPVGIDTFTKVANIYLTMAEKNAVFGINNLFPARVADRYHTYPAMKMNEDDRRACFEECCMAYELVANGGEVDLTESARLFCAFHSGKAGLGFGSMLVMSYDRARARSGDFINNIISPIYHSNLMLYMPGIDLLPDHISDPKEAHPDDFVDLNVFNVNIAAKTYSSQKENIPLLDRMALHCYGMTSNGAINIPSM